MLRILTLTVFALAFSACVPVDTTLSVSSPKNGGTYVGFDGETIPSSQVDTLPAQFTFQYSSNIGQRQVMLNGKDIGDKFTYMPTSASVDVEDIKDFLWQRENALVVDPLALGPAIVFYVDTEGPELIPSAVCIAGDVNCGAGTDEIQITMDYQDASPVQSVSVNGTPAAVVDGKWQVVTDDSPANDIFVLTATDKYGYQKTTHYLKDGASISEIFKAKVGEDAITALTPILDSTISGTVLDAEAIADLGLNKFLYVANAGVAHIYIKLIDIRIGQTTINGFSFDDLVAGRINLNMFMQPTVDYTFDDGNVSGDENQVGTYARVQMATTCIPKSAYEDDIEGLENPDFGFCVDDWGQINLLIETMNVSGDVDVSIIDSVFDVTLTDSVDLAMTDVEGVPLEDNSGIGNLISAIVPLLTDLGIFKTIMRELIESAISNNLNQIRIGMNISNDAGESFDLVTEAQSVTTDADSMSMTYSGLMDVRDRNPNVPRTLGSYYETEALGNYLGGDSNLQVNVNANVINQALNALYNIGMTHFTVYLADGEVLFGPQTPDDAKGNNGDLIIELYPAGPGRITFLKGATNQADIAYDKARLSIREKRDGQWEEIFQVLMDIKAGVLMSAHDSVFEISINGQPRFEVLDIYNNALPDWLYVEDDVIVGMIEVMFMLFYPLLDNADLTIDLPNLDNPEYPFTTEITTDAFDTTNGHLRFSMGINPVPK